MDVIKCPLCNAVSVPSHWLWSVFHSILKSSNHACTHVRVRLFKCSSFMSCTSTCTLYVLCLHISIVCMQHETGSRLKMFARTPSHLLPTPPPPPPPRPVASSASLPPDTRAQSLALEMTQRRPCP